MTMALDPVNPTGARASASSLVKEVVCPNCWERFRPERVRYIASHPDLYGDLLLGPNAPRRFLPSRFLPDGRAIDPRGASCHRLACPRCHLPIPRVAVERPTFFASIFGSPKSGKSYLLAAITHRLRKTMPGAFAINFSDSDPESNAILHGYEDELFSGRDPDEMVQLKKTEEVGDWYQAVRCGTTEILYPKPFLFNVTPLATHPSGDRVASVARTLCLYDNAGESFQPGADQPNNPVTQHMARAHCLFFVFDPTQEPEFRRACRNGSADPQMTMPVTSRQDVLLAEAARRVRTYRGLATNVRHDRPLVVLVTKFDAWQTLVGASRLENPWASHSSGAFSILRVDIIRRVSAVIRKLLEKHVPQIVSEAESFVDPSRVVYLPVSATGGPPQPDSRGNLRHRVGDINPMWVETPLLYALSQFVQGLVPSIAVQPPAAVFPPARPAHPANEPQGEAAE
jgi:hypothetical protein